MKLASFFRRGAARNDLWAGHDNDAKAQFLVNKVKKFLPEEPRHCDISCGTGNIMLAFKDVGCSSTGVEINPGLVEACRARGLEVVEGDITSGLPLGNAAFNVVSMISFLEHLREPQAAMSEFDRLLEADGIFVIQIPNRYFPVDLHYFLPFFGYLPEPVRNVYHRLFVGDNYGLDYYTAQMKKGEVRELFDGYEELLVENLVYPAEVAPHWARPLYKVFAWLRLLNVFPTGFLYVYRKN